MANDEMKDYWNGERGRDFVRLQDGYDAMLEPWSQELAGLAAVGPGERVLDVGCGCGATTLDAAADTGPGGAVLGADLSAPMIERARERAAEAGLGHVRFVVADAQVDDVGSGHDVVLSRFGLMFFDDPVAGFAHLRGAVRPGGRLATLSWAGPLEQEWLMVPGAAAAAHVPLPEAGGIDGPGMFGLADPDRTAATLTAAGWSDVAVERRALPMLLGGPGSVDEAMEFVLSTGPGRALLEGAPDAATRERAIEAVRAAFAGRLTEGGVRLGGTAWAITARAA